MDIQTITDIENLVTRYMPVEDCPVKSSAIKERRKKLTAAIIGVIEKRERQQPYTPQMEYKGGNVGESNLT